MEKAHHLEDMWNISALCRENDFVAPYLVLLYSIIDNFAWLNLPAKRDTVKGADYIEWVRKYVIPDSGLPCSAEDVYAARCAIVHTGRFASERSRAGHAKELHYVAGNQPDELLKDQIKRLGWEDRVHPVRIQMLDAAVRQGVLRFMDDVESDPARRTLVASRIESMNRMLKFTSED